MSLYRKILLMIFIVSSLLILVNLMIFVSESGNTSENFIQKASISLFHVVGICSINDSDNHCIYLTSETLGNPFLVLFVSTGITSLLLFFLRKELFKIWLVFSFVFIFISVIIVSNAPVLCSSLVCFNRTYTCIILGVVYFSLSLLIILLTYLILWLKNRNTNKKLGE